MSLVNVLDEVLENAVKYSDAINTVEVDVSGCTTLVLQSTIAVAGGAAFSFGPSGVNAATNVITKTNHGLTNHSVVKLFADGGGTLPSGLQADFEYRVSVLSSSTFQVVTKDDTSVVVALGDAGTGGASDFSCNESDFTSGTLYIGSSIDGVNWKYDAGTAFTGADTIYKEIADPKYKFYQLDYEFAAGVIVVSSLAFGKGPA